MSFEEVADFHNLMLAGEACCKGGRWKRSVQQFEVNMVQWAAQRRKELLNGTYKPSPTHDFLLNERGKQRIIRAHHVSDRMVYKSFCRHELIPAVNDLIMSSNAASQPGKGTDYAISRFKQDLVHAYKSCKGRDFYVATFDFHNYFGTIPHIKAYDKIAPRLSDNRSRSLLWQYMGIFSDEGIGVGIGGEPSQVIAVVYPSVLDRTIACDPRVIANGRYMDDSYFITRTKEDAIAVSDIFRKVSEELQLVINEKHSNIFWMEKDYVTFLKKRTFISDTGKVIMRLTKKNVTDEIRRLKYYKKLLDKGEMPMFAIDESFRCWTSYARMYYSYHSLVTITDTYCKLFNIPWEEARQTWIVNKL